MLTTMRPGVEAGGKEAAVQVVSGQQIVDHHRVRGIGACLHPERRPGQRSTLSTIHERDRSGQGLNRQRADSVGRVQLHCSSITEFYTKTANSRSNEGQLVINTYQNGYYHSGSDSDHLGRQGISCRVISYMLVWSAVPATRSTALRPASMHQVGLEPPGSRHKARTRSGVPCRDMP